MTEAEREPVAADPSRSFARSTWLFGRALGLVFLIAFVSFHVQLEGLIGARGIAPAEELLTALGARGLGFFEVPTVAWWLGASDAALHATCVIGELASVALLLGALPGPSALVASMLYLSLASIGGPFMAFQWDSLLVEVGLLAALLLPWQTLHRVGAPVEPSAFVRWALYLLAFRLMFLSGVVKLRSGDPAWVGLGALDYHYWTQPLPNPLSWPIHQLPHAVHAASVLVVFVVELALPFAIFLGARGRRAAFAGFAGLMGAIALSGSYGFFNLLTVTLCLPLLDDAAIAWVSRGRWPTSPGRSSPSPSAEGRGDGSPDGGREAGLRRAGRWLPAVLSIALGLLGAQQLLIGLGAGPSLPQATLAPLNAVTPLRIVNGYGLFAVMTKVRREIRFEGSLDGREWREYRFAYKPGDPRELPGLSAPHMPRLDWQMWFAALGTARQSPWLHRFMRRLLEAEPSVLGLLAHDPFDGRPPRFVRARLYDYRFGDLELLRREGAYWRVEELGLYTPVLTRGER